LEPQGAQVLLSLNAAAIYVGAALGSALGGAVIAGIGIGALGAAGAVVALCAALHLAVSVFLARRG
jgi:DHA1 family inner membrane transport protein